MDLQELFRALQREIPLAIDAASLTADHLPVASRPDKPKPGTRVVLESLPPGLLHDLPLKDQQAIRAIVGKPVMLVEYDDAGRAELEFTDKRGVIHYIYVKPEFIRATTATDR